MVRKIAQKVQIIRISDLSGKELGEGGQTVRFSLGNDSWEVDLSDKETSKFYDLLKPYQDAGTKVSGRGVRRSRSASQAPTVDTKAVRKWAESNGIEVSARGRIPGDVIEKFKAAGN